MRELLLETYCCPQVNDNQSDSGREWKEKHRVAPPSAANAAQSNYNCHRG